MIKRTCPILQKTFDCALEIIHKIFHFSNIDLQCLKITLKFKCLRGIKESKSHTSLRDLPHDYEPGVALKTSRSGK